MQRLKFRAALAVAACCWAQSFGSADALAQGNDAMLNALLRPAGWRADWRGPGGSGVTELVFQRQGETLTAKIRLILPFEMTCENPVTVGPGTVTFDGCRDPGLTLRFDPADQEIPFRGKTPRGYEWMLKAK
jgi:hypothetical protein